MKSADMLTTTEAARLAAVTPSTIKRWADQGLLPYIRTAGGHRRIERFTLERVLRAQRAPDASGDSDAAAWVHCLVHGRRHELDSRLLEARARHGAWFRVADELVLALVELGEQWARGDLSIAEEHVASDALARGLARIGDSLPTRLEGPQCALACAGDDEHTLGLSLAELCLREAGWTPLWLGRRTPSVEVLRVVRSNRVTLLALSASQASSDRRPLGRLAREVGTACEERGVGLVLGGGGAWPAEPAYGARLSSFTLFRQYLEAHGSAHERSLASARSD
jgi:excisionase family DNA binding protein